MSHIALLAAAAIAFFLLCASRPRHQRALLGRKLSGRAAGRMRTGGWVLLCLGLGFAWWSFGLGRGLVLAFGYASLGAGSVVGFLTYRSEKAQH
jgi:hypothetical protein